MAPVVDAQVHVWLPESPTRPWPGWGREWRDTTHRVERVDGEVLLREMDEAGVDRAVLVPPMFEGHRNDYAIASARAFPERFRVMVRLDLSAKDIEDKVTELIADPVVSGVRLTFLPADTTALGSTEAAAFWQLAQGIGFPVMVTSPWLLPSLRDIAFSHPGVRIAVDHLGLSGTHKDASIRSEINALIELAACPNVSVKLTALPCFSTEPYPYPQLHDPVARVLDAFGTERLFWGSDLSRLRGSYRECITLVIDHLGLTPAESAAVLGGNLLRWLPWQEL